jgi:hypothetical protein
VTLLVGLTLEGPLATFIGIGAWERALLQVDFHHVLQRYFDGSQWEATELTDDSTLGTGSLIRITAHNQCIRKIYFSSPLYHQT